MRSRSSSGAVLWLTPKARSSAIALPLGHIGELTQFPVDSPEAHGHDRDVDQQEGKEDDIGAGDVLARLVERQRGGGDRDHPASLGTGAMRELWAGTSSPSSARRRRPIFARDDFAASSNRTSVSHRSAMPAKQTQNVIVIFVVSPPSAVANTRG